MRYVLVLVVLLVAPLVIAETATNEYLQPVDVLCSNSGTTGNWGATCTGTYTTGNDACEDALISCDDTNAEVLSNSRNNLLGVDARSADVNKDPVSQCDTILGVRVEYRYTTQNNPTERAFEVSNDDGASWQDACGGTPDVEGTTHACDVSAVGWTCEDFFGGATQARARITAQQSGGAPQTVYELSTNYLVFFVDYNFTTNALSTDLVSYEQSDVVNISGADIWGASEDVTIGVSNEQGLVDQVFVTTNASGSFETAYTIADYASTGVYVLNASQDSDPSITAQANFTVNTRAPQVQTQRAGGYYNRSETATFVGDSFARNATIFVEVTSPSDEVLLSTSTTSSSQGTLSFDYLFENNFTVESGLYNFTFTEQANTSYQSSASAQLVVLPETATRSTDGVDLLSQLYVFDSDFALFTALGGQEDFFELGYYEVFPQGAKITALSFDFFHREDADSAGAFVKWLNPATTTWDTVCSLPANSAARWSSCDLTSVVTNASVANNLQVRVSDDSQAGGGDSWNYEVDVALVRGSFTLEPGISNVQVSDVTTRSASISWSTSNEANATVRYGLTQSFGNVSSNSSFATSHSFLLDGLDDDLTYYYEVESCTAYGCETQGPFTFTTQEETVPTISNLSVVVSASGANFSWSTDRNTTSELAYGTSPSYGSLVSNSTSTTAHSFSLTNLSVARTYYYSVESCDALGCTSSTGSFKTAPPAGACSWRYAEKAPDHEEGLIKRGDVVVLDCRLASALQARADLRVQLAWPNELLSRLVSAPRLLYQEPEVLYP